MVNYSSMEKLELATAEEVSDFLATNIPEIDEAILDNFRKHKIDGSVFVQLTDEYLRELAPLLGDRLKIKRLVTLCLNSNMDPIYSPPPFSANSELSPSTNSTKKSSVSGDTPVLSQTLHPKALNPKKRNRSPSPFKSDDASYCSLTNWVDKITIPTRFSKSTMNCIGVGILSSHARDEIVSSLSTCIMLFTTSPTPEERQIVCKKLIDTHPSLKDSVGSGYDSWCKKLKEKFKNLHRSDRALKAGITLPSKKSKAGAETEEESTSNTDMEMYERSDKKLRSDFISGKWSMSSLSSLIEDTFTIRRQHLKSLPVEESFEKFPWLKEPSLMMKEFSLITKTDTSNFKSSWEQIEDKVLKYAEFEEKRKVKTLLKQYNSQSSDPVCSSDSKTAYVLLILSALFAQRGQNCDSFSLSFEDDVIDIENTLSEVIHTHPYVAAFGKSTNHLSDPVVVIEKRNIIHTETLASALHFAFASYYVFDIKFPKNIKGLLVFLEQIVYKLKPTATVNTTATIVIDSIMKL